MKFWLPKIIFGLILISLAFFLLKNQDFIFAPSDRGGQVAEIELPVQQRESTSIKDTTIKPQTRAVSKESSNAAAEGLSRFYASINSDLGKKGPRIKNHVVYLPDPKGDIDKLLEARRLVTRPLRANWQGDKESRPFRVGQTVFQKLSEYAEDNGLQVIWWLNRDFLVKDPFRINKNIIDTAYQLGKGVEGHFENGVSTFFCYRHRTLVLIDLPTEYIKKECTLLKSKTGYN
ncbi:hypothetical protein SG34_023225 [Thalassomonas viridans]|uniref:Toxin co-regulated pilus biosynthesis protein Q C-terminal domain-containing protein n=1 Tax=Thalassomonas viridans TaxID=137584 RepID=A0AAE9Z068_9GAMM|nr:TcpQ domain-containing protein [Thalassomonas viridans]WDE04225.1 hypothetical protein SG34_023225 [Thalassomonas viridans]